MQKMYEDYGDMVEIRLVYIREAHASDSSWPVEYAKEKGISEHKDYSERCQTAEMLLKDKKLTIPTIIDGMDNAVNKAYKAYTNRVFLVRKDGRLAVAGKRGPRGFKPGLNAAKRWLVEYKETGKEPVIVIEEAVAAKPAAPAPDAAGFEPVLGEWDMETDFQGRMMASKMSLVARDGKVYGTWTTSRGRGTDMLDLSFKGDKLSFKRAIGNDMTITFEGKVEGDKVVGKHIAPFGEMACTGKRNGGAGTNKEG